MEPGRVALSLLALALSAPLALSGHWNQRRFSRPDACSLAAASGTGLGNVSRPAGLSECAVECGRESGCVALLHQLGLCYKFNWTLFSTVWFGGGAPCPENFFLDELSYSKLNFTSCQQISIDFAAPCQLAIDGNTSQNFWHGSCTHTGSSAANWWQAQLPQPAYIGFIAIYNRQDCCGERLNNFTIRVDGAECARYKEPPGSWFSVRNFSCGRVGQTVRLELGQLTALTVCEVVPYGRFLN